MFQVQIASMYKILDQNDELNGKLKIWFKKLFKELKLNFEIWKLNDKI